MGILEIGLRAVFAYFEFDLDFRCGQGFEIIFSIKSQHIKNIIKYQKIIEKIIILGSNKSKILKDRIEYTQILS